MKLPPGTRSPGTATGSDSEVLRLLDPALGARLLLELAHNRLEWWRVDGLGDTEAFDFLGPAPGRERP